MMGGMRSRDSEGCIISVREREESERGMVYDKCKREKMGRIVVMGKETSAVVR